jgi:MFS family permease
MTVNHSGGFLTLLKKRNFLRIWLAQLISLTMLNASNYALLILIETATHSTTLVGLAIICFSVPAVILGGPAGVFVDHMNKRRVLWASNCLRAIATLIFMGVLLINHNLLLPAYLLTFLISSIGQFFTPAEGSAIPQLVSEEELMPALSLFNITFMLSQALGFILFAPILLSFLPTFHISRLVFDPLVQLYGLIALFYFVCALLIVLIPKASFREDAKQAKKTGTLTSESISILSNVWSEMYQGWSFVRRNKALFLAIIQLSFAGILMLVISQLATPIVTQLLGLPATSMAFIFAPAGIGLVAGSVLMPHISRHTGKPRAILIGVIMLSIATLLLPLVTILAHILEPHDWNSNPLLLIAVAIIMAAAGFALDFINIPALTAVQELTPDWIKGRVLALQLVLYNACSIPIILFIGVFADIFGLDRVLYLMTVGEIAFGVWGVYYHRKHKQQILGSDETEDEQKELEEIAP